MASRPCWRKSGGAMRITVTDPNGAEVYAGGDKNAAIVAMVETLTNLPVPGQLIGGGVALRKFKQYQKTLVMGKKAEGYALSPFKAALKSKKPAEVEEAQAILDSIEKAKARLADDIKEDLKKEKKVFLAFINDLNPIMDSLVKNQIQQQANIKKTEL